MVIFELHAFSPELLIMTHILENMEDGRVETDSYEFDSSEMFCSKLIVLLSETHGSSTNSQCDWQG